MDKIELDIARKEHGAAYLQALKSLGLHPDGLFWVHDKLEDRFVLVLATELFDFKGPLAITKLLFKAYNVCATPKEIDPFIVRLHSPRQAILKEYAKWNSPNIEVRDEHGQRLKKDDGTPVDTPVLVEGITLGETEFRHAWVYCFQLPAKRGKGDLIRRWKKLESSVDKFAA